MIGSIEIEHGILFLNSGLQIDLQLSLDLATTLTKTVLSSDSGSQAVLFFM